MLDVIKDALFDSLKLLPFLFIVYVIMEFIEHKSSKKTQSIIKKSGKFGPLVGSIFGAFPQCGFSVMASNLYVAKIISMGTLIGIYLSTSDEMIPIMISSGSTDKVFKIVLFKVVIGIIIGFLIDILFFRKKTNSKQEIHKLCEHDHCNCEDENIFISSLKHTIKIFAFILIINLIMNTIIYFIGENTIGSILKQNNFVGPIISAVVGLIPNCAASVVITELFIEGTITFGSLMAGLLSSSGLGLLILFKMNKNMKDNFTVLSIICLISILIGILLNIFNIMI